MDMGVQSDSSSDSSSSSSSSDSDSGTDVSDDDEPLQNKMSEIDTKWKFKQNGNGYHVKLHQNLNDVNDENNCDSSSKKYVKRRLKLKF